MRKAEKRRIENLVMPFISSIERFIEYMLPLGSTENIVNNSYVEIDHGEWKNFHNEMAKFGHFIINLASKFNYIFSDGGLDTFGGGKINKKDRIDCPRTHPSEKDKELIYEMHLMINDLLKYSKVRRSNYGLFMSSSESVTFCLKAQYVEGKIQELVYL